jgi:hypothetical protein
MGVWRILQARDASGGSLEGKMIRQEVVCRA